MPIVPHSSYLAPRWLRGAHTQTIFPTLFRKTPQVSFTRSSIAASDGDRIVLDTVYAGPDPSETAVILSHGLEGDSHRKYIRGMAAIFAPLGWDSVARNFRGCGGEMNRTPGLYHSGQTDDLHDVALHCVALGYKRIFLVGFSMGGNQTLKYLGENPQRVPAEVRGAAAFSVPCHLPGAAKVLDRPGNALYMWSFLRTLREKVRRKHALYPVLYPLDGLDAMRTFAEFDERYTAPVHGFASAEEYWQKAACLPHLHSICVPTLLVNAKNDPFLSQECYPKGVAHENAQLFLEMPEEGGHVGFTPAEGGGAYWSERRAAEFFTHLLQAHASGAGG